MIEISSDKCKLDLDLIHNYLSEDSYWAKGRSIETVKRSIVNSLCFGIYENDEQIGFARVVTDYAVFAWLLDVFILDTYQGKGYGKNLLSYIMAHPELQGLQRWGLGTNDAHGLYNKFGFEALDHPEFMMEKKANPA